ncbi:MAG: biopolymer transporter ExbD [Treponema sp.]|jgi:biopolymer transport protein ExbD|nr:biopolymer transporter ExbD [Treponema sp.]
MKTKIKRRHGANLSLVPLVDIVFQLILFFVVSTTFAVIPAVTVSIPKSGTTEAALVSGIIIELAPDNTILLNGKKIRLQNIGRALATFEQEPVTLVCDKDVSSAQIVRIFDELRKAGFVQVDLRTLEK